MLKEQNFTNTGQSTHWEEAAVRDCLVGGFSIAVNHNNVNASKAVIGLKNKTK